MTPFVLCAAALLALTLALLVPPLWRTKTPGHDRKQRDQNISITRSQLAELEIEYQNQLISDEAFATGKRELHRRLLEDTDENNLPSTERKAQPSRRMALALILGLPLISALGYLTFGNSRALDDMAMTRANPQVPEQLAVLADKLAARLKDNPTDSEGRVMLARTYKALGRLDEAMETFGQLDDSALDSPDTLTEFADLLAMKNNGDLSGKPLALVERALRLDPNHITGLWLAGTAAFNAKEYRGAATFWERALNNLPADSEDVEVLKEGIAEARKRSGFRPDMNKSVSGTVSLAPELKKAVSPTDTVFVFAKDLAGGRLPVSIAKARVADLPMNFVLDDQSAMNPDSPISAQTEVQVVARISRSGNAIAKPDDLESAPIRARVGTKGLKIVVDHQR